MEEQLPELPPLPDSAFDVWDDYYDGITLWENGPYDRYAENKLWTADQMRAYALEAVRMERGRMQAKIDALMIEYCPDDMTEAQLDEWAKHQKPVSRDHEAAVDAALGITRKSIREGK